MNVLKSKLLNPPPKWQVVLLVAAGMLFNMNAIIGAGIGAGYGEDPVAVRLGIAAATALMTSALLTGFGWLVLLRRCSRRTVWITFGLLFLTGALVGFFSIR